MGDDYFRTAIAVNFMQRTITQSDLSHVAELPELVSVNLGDTQIVDDKGTARPIQDSDLVVIEHLTGLHNLVLNYDRGVGQISDVGLEHLRGLVELDELYLISWSATTVCSVSRASRTSRLSTCAEPRFCPKGGLRS